MHSSRILFAQLFAAAILAALTWVAVSHSLYWRFWWFDIPMHFLGGVWAGFCISWIFARRDMPLTLTWCLVFGLVVGIGWEIFEYVEGIATPYYLSYPFDTAKDIIMDLLGAAAGYFLVYSTRKKNPDSKRVI